MNRWRIAMMALVVLAVTSVAVTGCAGSGGGGSSGGTQNITSPNTIVEKDIQFQPNSIEVKVGDTVTFDNQDSVPHLVDISGTRLSEQQPGQTVTWKAATAGKFSFRCVIHPSMTGEITVK